jgi:ATP-binding cassette subfamily B protein
VDEKDKSEKTKIKLSNLVRVLHFLKPYRGLAAATVLMLLVNVGIEAIQPQIARAFLNGMQDAVAGRRPDFQPWLFGAAILLLWLVRSGNSMGSGMLRTRLSQKVVFDIRCAVYNAIQRHSFSFHARTNTGELISRSTTDIGRLQNFWQAMLYTNIEVFIVIAVSLICIAQVSWVFFTVAVVSMLPTTVLVTYFASKLKKKWREVHDHYGEMTTALAENIQGVRVVKAFAQEEREITKFDDRQTRYMERVLHVTNYWAARMPVATLIFGFAVPVTLLLGGGMVIRGEIKIGDLMAVIFYINNLGWRFGMIGQIANTTQQAASSSERIFEILDEPELIVPGNKAFPQGKGEVVFANVSFHYRENKPSIHNVSFIAEGGKMTAIVGPTGSGKSTLVNLIPRFYDVSEGSILIDGVDIRHLSLTDLRRNIGIIFQETFLFSTTIAENISYGRKDATRAEIEAAAKAAQAHDFIMELEHGYETAVGERGVTLSGGQKQRVAIARAFLMNPRILILDDATASVDSRTERFIQEAMRQLAVGRTTFVIAQRLSTVHRADQIIVLNQGRVVERGTHDELLKRQGFYKDLYEQQFMMKQAA